MLKSKSKFIEVTKNYKLFLIPILLILVFLPSISSSYTTFLIIRIMITSLSAMSLILLAGYGGLLSFAQISFYGISAYVLGISVMNYNLSFTVAILLSLLISVGIGAVFAIIAIRTKGNYFIMMTLAFGQLVYLSALQWVELTGGFNGITGIPGPKIFNIKIEGNTPVYYLVLIIVGLCYYILKRISKAPFGLVLQGVRDNSMKMSALGFNTQLHKYLTFIISGFFAAVSGILAVLFYGLISPNMVTLSASVMLLFVALIGCINKFEGAILGAAIYVMLEDFASKYTQRYMIIIGVFFILVVLFMPSGILGQRLLRKKHLGNESN